MRRAFSCHEIEDNVSNDDVPRRSKRKIVYTEKMQNYIDLSKSKNVPVRSAMVPDASVASLHDSVSNASKSSKCSKTSSMLIEAAAELEAKKIELAAVEIEEQARAQLELLKFEQKRALEEQESKLKKIMAEKEVKVAQAKVDTYARFMSESESRSIRSRGNMSSSVAPLRSPEIDRPRIESRDVQSFQPVNTPITPDTHVDSSKNDICAVSNFAKVLSESVNLSRMPVPEPPIFTGDPLKYFEWKTAFSILIERKNIPSSERIFYLKKYVGFPASKAIHGLCMSFSESSYERAKQVLDERYGHPFNLQKAFRDKLDCWPKISPKDVAGLIDFGDFLQGCRDAMFEVPGLEILNDCYENKKLLLKLPDWAVMRWNRIVAESSDAVRHYPNFSQFVDFVCKEAKIASHPISSPFALHADKRSESRDHGKENHKVKVFATAASSSPPVSKNEHVTKPENAKAGRVCECCNVDSHYLHKCETFLKLTCDQKQSFVREKHLCFGCLLKGHSKMSCKRKHRCDICKKWHPTCLHDDRFVKTSDSSNEQSQTQTKAVSSHRVCRSDEIGTRSSTSMIVPVWVSSGSSPSDEILTYALLDTQSDTSFILDDLLSKLQDRFDLRVNPSRLSLSTMTSAHSIIDCVKVSDLKLRAYDSHEEVVLSHAFSRNFIPVDRSHIPVKSTMEDWPHLQHLKDALPNLLTCEVGLLIGYNCPQALAPQQVITGGKNEPFGVKTALGWSVVGGSNVDHENDAGICHRVSVKEMPVCFPSDAVRILESDFANDAVIDEKVSQDDLRFMSLLKEQVIQREDKHIEMPLPFKKRPTMPDNKMYVMKRLENLKQKLRRNEEYLEHYTIFMNEIIERGDVERVESPAPDGHRWYIPHHGVYHPKKPGKVRVVFDCSSTFKGTSLNQHLLTGPDLINSLIGVLTRFRQYPVAIMCDIEKMFHQFIVSEKDRDFLRFLWWENGDIDSEPIEYRMKVHLFGAASSPGCANFGLKHLANLNKSTLPQASSFVLRDFYVDDGLTSVESVNEAIQLTKDARELCANGGLRLHKFISNDKEVIRSIPISERASEIKDTNLQLDPLPIAHVLGVSWDIEKDSFFFQASEPADSSPTRRGILSTVASMYDPLGFLAPFTLTGKRILQEMCRSGIDWDECVPPELEKEWKDWVDDFQFLNTVSISRCMIPPPCLKYEKVELHHFSDASSTGYGQCSYLRLVSSSSVHCSFVIGKARVAPKKTVTIPRLELNAALLSAKMSLLLRKELSVSLTGEYFWTDLRVVLGYVNNESRRFHTFVANRVKLIRDITEPDQWHYVESAENPSDHASRGLRSLDISSSSWLKGPSFLWQPQLKLQAAETSLQLDDPEVKVAKCLHTSTETLKRHELDLTRFSSWSKAVAVVARLKRLADGVSGTHAISVQERERAENRIVELMQMDVFRESRNFLLSNEELPKGDQLYSLDPFVEDGLIRVGGRLANANETESYKHPLILPKDHHVTKLIISYAHEQVKHQGRGLTLNNLRSLGYWVIGGSKVIRNFIRQCVTCRRLRRTTEVQKMADLPSPRVDPSPPFLFCGIDVFGPFYVNQRRVQVKRYGLLVTCMCSRAIHIEMLDDLSTDAFINGLRCFISIRGFVKQIQCDNGSNFVGAARELNKNRLSSYFAERHCEFVFNPPDASHAGGVWERQIRTVRDILSSILLTCPRKLDDSSLRTVFYEVMAIVNSRPLSVSELDNPKEIQPLTPNHILTAKANIPYPPPGEFERSDIYLRKRWRRVQYLLEQFWAQWKREYLNQISLRQKWHTPRRNMRVGDIVIVKDIDLPRNHWPMGMVVDAKQGSDGLVRTVKVRLGKSDSVLERSIHKLVLLVESQN